MAVAVGRNVALPGVYTSRGCALKETSSSSSRVSLPSSSGRGPHSWRVTGQPTVVRCESRATRKQEILVDNDLGTRNALKLHIAKETSGLELLSVFEGQLAQKSQDVAKLNDGTTIFLVGMMASGKSTVGRVLADALNYKFFDSDEVIQSYVGGMPVKEIFRQHSEAAFRDLETRALEQLSAASCLVVATGGGAVCRDQNWSYLRDGIVVWLDVPVEDLARRVTEVSKRETESRPLLGGDCTDFENAFSKLSQLMDAREQHYARAHCRLCFRDLASNLGLTEISALTPTAIAVQALEEIKQVLKEGKFIPPPVGY